jgi:hypothetical protein
MAGETNPVPTFRDPDTAPIVYFDVAPTFGTMNGAVQIELATRVLVPVPDGSVRLEFVINGRLRCSPAAAASLREALDKSLEMLQQPQAAPAAAAAGKLN